MAVNSKCLLKVLFVVSIAYFGFGGLLILKLLVESLTLGIDCK